MQKIYENILFIGNLISLSLSYSFLEIILNSVFSNTGSAEIWQKWYGYDPVIALHLGAGREEIWSGTGFFRKKDMERGPWVGVGSLGGAIPAFLMFLNFS